MRAHEKTYAQTREKTLTIVVIGVSGVRSIEVGRV